MGTALLKLLALPDLRRYGRANDGGYVCSSRLVENTEVLLSFGINDDWSFENDFVKASNAYCVAFDFSISRISLLQRGWSQVRFFFGDILKRRSIQVNRISTSFTDFRNFVSFNLFFQQNKFYKLGLGKENETVFRSIKTIMEDYVPKNKEIFLKLDIEGMEYQVIEDILQYSGAITGIAIEFHNVHDKLEEFEQLITLLQQQYYAYHIHENNYGILKTVEGWPDVLEISLIRKDQVEVPQFYDDFAHLPFKNLDMLNDPEGERFVWQK